VSPWLGPARLGRSGRAAVPLDFAALRHELDTPDGFPAAVTAEAAARADTIELPDLDRTDLPLVTVDPVGSMDLDQAVHIAADGDGYLVSYAIADVASFVPPDGALAAEVLKRGQTLYFPDARVPLHPPVLSEGAASLLPDQVRPAVLWQIRLDAAGAVDTIDVRRARVRSRARLDYLSLQADLDRGQAPDAVALLPTVGRLRRELARARHAIDLQLPQQEVEQGPAGGWQLVRRAQLPVELDNAEISLLTGMCAASLMLEAGIGLLRTLPPPESRTVAELRRIAPALDVSWPTGTPPGSVLDSLDRSQPKHVAFLEHAAMLLRGAGYTAFADGPPAQPQHAGLGAPYAHVTAPLRRLIDRFATEICLSVRSGAPVPAWVRERLDELPKIMQGSDRFAHEIDRAVVDATEAWLLTGREGETFEAVVLAANGQRGTVALTKPAVEARCEGAALPVGEQITVRLTSVDVSQRLVRFELA
jgi:exoribonuclease R